MQPHAPRRSSSLRRVVILFAAVFSFGLAAIAAMVLVFGSKGGVPKGAVLWIDLSAPLTEAGGVGSPLEALLGEPRHSLAAHAAARAVRHAATDKRIRAILLRGGYEGSLGALDLLRDALVEAREQGAYVVAAPGSADERTLWLCSAADSIWLEPLGGVQLDGWVAELPYLGDGLARYGLEMQVTRAGKYKSAVEPFVLGRMSPENREQLDHILAAVEQKVLGDLSAARSIPLDTLRQWTAERGWFSAEEARAAGLVTHVGPYHELLGFLREKVGRGPGEEVPTISLADYSKRTSQRVGGGPGIAVLVAEGEIVDGSATGAIGGDDLARELRAAREDEDTAAVVLRVDSPGGSATASDVIRAEVLALRAEGKPVVVSMGSLAASGGYWISADADHIVAHPYTLTGSIGVFGMLPNAEAFLERHGLRAEQVRTSPLGGVDSLWKRKDERQMELIQSIVDDIYDAFLDLVAKARGLERAAVEELAQGRVWSGARALELGLVDELGGLDRAVAVARERAGLDADAPIRFPARELPWLEQILSEALSEPSPDLTRALRRTRAARELLGAAPGETGALAALLWQRLEGLSGSRGAVARLPFDWIPR